MEAKELRIGNWVYSITHKKNHKVIKLEFDSILNVEPIPLTEEILLKCGFEKTGDYGDQIYYEPKNRGNRNYYICFDHDEICFGFASNGSYTDLLYDDANLQHLHQLQNLYFALTGEELNVDL